MIEIYSTSLVRAIGKVLQLKFLARTPINTHKGDEKWPLFVFQTAVLVVHINNTGQ